MTNWLVILSQDNWNICIQERKLGMPRQSQLDRMTEGDQLWVYIGRARVDRQVPKLRRLRALAKVAGPIEALSAPKWRARGAQAFSFARPISLIREFDVPGHDLLGRLSFAGGRPRWGLQLLQTPIRLTDGDQALLNKAISHALRAGTRLDTDVTP